MSQAKPVATTNKALSTSGSAASFSLRTDTRILPFEPRTRCQPSPPLQATLRDRSRFALTWEVSLVKADHIWPDGIEAVPQPAA